MNRRLEHLETPDADTLHVCLFRHRAGRDLLRICAQGVVRTLHRARDIRILPARDVLLRAHGKAPAQADGDPAGTTDLRIRLQPGALTLLRCPATA